MLPIEPDFRGLIDDASHLLLSTAENLADEDVAVPARHCPGWTRGHVLTHIARSGDAMRNLLVWARTGVEIPAYRSGPERDAAINAGAGRGAEELLVDVRDSAATFREELDRPAERSGEFRVRVLDGAEFPVSEVALRRLVELELHHVDLDAGYDASDWSSEFAAMPLPEPMRSHRASRKPFFHA